VTCKAKGIGSDNRKSPNMHINKYVVTEKCPGQRPVSQNRTVPQRIPAAQANGYSRVANNLLATV
jgi:hypothetical protein